MHMMMRIYALHQCCTAASLATSTRNTIRCVILDRTNLSCQLLADLSLSHGSTFHSPLCTYLTISIYHDAPANDSPANDRIGGDDVDDVDDADGS